MSGLSLWFVITLVVYATGSPHSTSTKTCAWYESICLTKAVQKVYDNLVNGMPGLTEPIDPMYLERVGGHVKTFGYELTNVTMTGLRNCTVELLKFDNIDQWTYNYNLHCPLLVFDFNYTTKGKLDVVEFDVEGQGSITTEDYLILVTGVSEKYLSEKDNKLRFDLKDYEFKTVLGGKFLYVNKSFSKGEKEKIDFCSTYINSHADIYETSLRTQVLKNFMDIYAQRVNTYLRAFPIEEIFKKE